MAGLISTFATVLVTGIITLAVQAYAAKQGRKMPEHDGDVIVLQHGKGSRVGMVIVGLLVVSLVPGAMLFTGMLSSTSRTYQAVLWGLVAFLTVAITLGGIEMFRYRVIITAEGIAVRGLRGERFVLFEEVRDVVDGHDTLRIKVERGRAISLSKSMAGWGEAERRVRTGWRMARA
ncbi:hypothetical protein OT109_12725 [Phycisphaeraceae bacterium D3-23]